MSPSVDRSSMTFEQLMGSLALIEVYVLFAETTAAMPAPTSPEAVDTYRRHLLYMYELEDRGTLLAAGALDFRDLSKGKAMIALRVDSEEAALAVVADDPLHQAGWITYTVHTWQVNEGTLVEPLRQQRTAGA